MDLKDKHLRKWAKNLILAAQLEEALEPDLTYDPASQWQIFWAETEAE